MTDTSRRNFIGSIVSLGCFGGLGVAAAPAFAQPPVSIPPGAMVLSRLQERSLRDGAVVRVVRRWEVSFKRNLRGIAISGSQLDVSVEAPPSLAPIAAIEESRSTAEMWPVMLSNDGSVMNAGSDVQAGDFSAAVQKAEQMIRDGAQNSPEQTTRIQYLSQLQNIGASLFDQMPNDLFFPAGQPQYSKQELELPGGISGEFEISYDARPSPQEGWLDRAVRQVTTRIGESQKYALEEWVLSQA